MKKRIERIAHIAICVALIIICSWIYIPLVVPITLQTFAIFSVLGFLGGKKGTLAVLCYVLIGALGFPVFSNFKGGIAIILNDFSGGYIIGFIIVALIYWAAQAIFGQNPAVELIALAVGLVTCYLVGTLWYVWINARVSNTLEFFNVLSVCVTPFIAPDVAKLASSFVLVKKLRKHLKIT